MVIMDLPKANDPIIHIMVYHLKIPGATKHFQRLKRKNHVFLLKRLTHSLMLLKTCWMKFTILNLTHVITNKYPYINILALVYICLHIQQECTHQGPLAIYVFISNLCYQVYLTTKEIKPYDQLKNSLEERR